MICGGYMNKSIVINYKNIEYILWISKDLKFCCNKKVDCDGCPYAYGDERGFLLCIFSVCPDHWDKYIKWLEEDNKNE